MLKRLKRTLTKLATPRKERIDGSRVRCLLERLEERAMLSVSYGSPHTYGDFGAPPPGQFNDSAAFAPPSNHSASYATNFGAMRDGGRSSPMYGDLRSPSQLQGSFEQHLPSEQTNRQYSTAPSTTWTMVGYMQSVHPNYTTTTFFLLGTPAMKPPVVPTNAPPNLLPDHDDFVLPNRSDLTGKVVPRLINGSAKNPNDYDTGKTINFGSQSGIPLLGDHTVGIPDASAVFAFARTMTDSSAGLPGLSHESSTATVLTAVARDLAFQEYSPTALSGVVTNAYDRVSLNAMSSEATTSDLLEGFITSTDLTKADDIVASSDAVAGEREAVDAVLQSLHDIDTLLPVTASTELKIQIDLQTDAAVEELTSSEFDGGMVLIQPAGTSDDGGFDLTPVYADHLERFDAPAKMETSVGLFQAVDVAVDEIPVADIAQPSTPTVEVQPEIRADGNLPTKREQSSSNKAASVVGVATLTGALVWMNSGKRSRDGRAAQKRRVGRS